MIINILVLIGVFGAVATKQANITSIPPIQIKNSKNANHDDINVAIISAMHIAINKIVKAIEIGLVITNVRVANVVIIENNI